MNTDGNGLVYRYEDLDQYDLYDDEFIIERHEEYATPIGEYFLSFSQLESLLDMAIEHLLSDRSDSKGLHVINFLDFKEKLKLFSHMCQSKLHLDNNEHEKHRLKEFKKSIISACEIRNIIAHANWMTITKDHFVRADTVSDSNGGHIKFKYYKLSPQVLRELDARLEKLSSDFEDFLTDHRLD